MNYLISSDWHFNNLGSDEHKSILTIERGNKFSTIQEHDRYIVNSIYHWLKKLNKDDTFYFLGDFGRPTVDTFYELLYIFKATNCHKVAIRGNHDRETEISQMNKLFDVVYDYPIFITSRILLSHQPAAVWGEQVNVHGHTHSSKLNLPNYICASIHVADYKPITPKQVQNTLNRGPKHDYRFLYEPWAANYQFTQKKEDVICDKNGNIDLAASRLMHRLNQKGYNKSGESE